MSPGRLSAPRLDALHDALSDRDRRILLDLIRVRVLAGGQLDRLHFHTLSPSSQHRVRRRVLERLASLGLAAMLERRVGGVRAGSAGHVYALGLAGQRILPLLTGEPPPARARQPWTPGRLFLAHALDVAELYVRLREHERTGALELQRYDAEPQSWYPTGFGGVLKPDALTVVRSGAISDTIWLEVDRATESLPTLRRKLLGYVDFALSGQLGPGDVVPRVLVTVPHEKRLTAVSELIAGLPEPASNLIHVELHYNSVETLAQGLNTL